MIDTTQLNTLIAALKAETQKDAITPNSLGSLLEKISQLLATASSSSDTTSLTGLQTALATLQAKVNSHIQTQESVGSLVAGISNGSDSQTQVNLTLSKTNISTNGKQTVSLAIGAATASKAGVMTSQQVADLNTAKSDASAAKSGVTALQTSVSAVQSSVTGVQNSVSGIQETITSLQSTISSLQSAVEELEEGATGSSSSSSSGSDSGTATSSTPYYHIECQARNGEGMHVIGANKLIEMDYKPYLFRYSKKQCRYRRNMYEERRAGRKQRGWNLFCDASIVGFEENDLMKVAKHNGNGVYTSASFTDPMYLFYGSTLRNQDTPEVELRVAYGCETYNVYNGKRFRYGIAFGPQQPKEKFDFTKLVTNIAEFGVKVCYDPGSSWFHLSAKWSR